MALLYVVLCLSAGPCPLHGMSSCPPLVAGLKPVSSVDLLDGDYPPSPTQLPISKQDLRFLDLCPFNTSCLLLTSVVQGTSGWLSSSCGSFLLALIPWFCSAFFGGLHFHGVSECALGIGVFSLSSRVSHTPASSCACGDGPFRVLGLSHLG